MTRCVVGLLLVGALVVGSGCGNDESGDSKAATPQPTTTRPATTPSSELATVEDVLASRIRGEFPGVRDTTLAAAGATLSLRFDVGPEEKPGGPRDFAQLAAGELQTVAPEVLRDVKTVEVRITTVDNQVTEGSFGLYGDLLPVN